MMLNFTLKPTNLRILHELIRPCGPLPQGAFKTPSLKATEEGETCEHELPILLASVQFSRSVMPDSL